MTYLMTVFGVHLDNRSAPDLGKWCGPSGQAARTLVSPSSTKSHHAGSISTSQPGVPPCWTSPLAFGLIVWNYTFLICGILGFPNTNTALNLSDGQYNIGRRHGFTRIMTRPAKQNVSNNVQMYQTRSSLLSSPCHGTVLYRYWISLFSASIKV